MYDSDNDLPEAPTLEEIAQTQDDLEKLKERIEQYIEVASAVNNKIEDEIPDRAARLDELPYGEEEVRLRGDLGALEDAASALKEIEETIKEVATKYQEVLEAIKEGENTLEECSDLPDSSEEEEDEFEEEEEDEF